MQDYLILLPHDPTLLIQDLSQKIHYLNLMKQWMEHSLLAITQFQNRNLKHFDAQVGDTLCQIRAYKIYCLATILCKKTSCDLNQLQSHLLRVIPIITAHKVEYEGYLMKSKSQCPHWMRAKTTLRDLFSQFDTVVPLSQDALFIVLSHFLCHFHQVDEECIPMSIDVRQIASEWKVSTSYAKKLTHYVQKTLASASCSFMFELLSELPKHNPLHSILPLLHLEGDKGRMVLPCHAVTEIIMHHMLQVQAQVVLTMKINTPQKHEIRTFQFKGDPILNEFVMVKDTALSDELPCMVFYGLTNQNEMPNSQAIPNRISLMGLSHMILTSNAAHPQYAGKALFSFRENPYTALIHKNSQLNTMDRAWILQLREQLQELQLKAERLGLTQSNPSFCFLKHIFCSTTDEYQPNTQKKIPDSVIN